MQILHGYSVLIVEPDLDAALALQDSLTMDGARVLTAYGVTRALEHAETTQLSAAIVGNSISAADRKTIYRQLSQRKIPVMLHDEVARRTAAQLKIMGTAARVVDAISHQLGRAASGGGSYSNC